jgi:hypothetical protein
MLLYAAFCDLCRGEGELVIATHTYRTDSGTWHCCEDHAGQAQASGFMPQELQTPGDVDPDVLTA